MTSGDRPFPAVLDRVRPRDALDLMTWPWFSLAKTKRTAPIGFEQRDQYLRVSAPDVHYGIATIWDADILIWAVSQLTEANDQGLRVGRRIEAPPYQILRYLGRGIAQRQYVLLGAALDRLAATRIEINLRTRDCASQECFSLLDGWHRNGAGVTLEISEWLFNAVVINRRVLTIDPRYLRLTGGVERWLWRLVRKHAGDNPQDGTSRLLPFTRGRAASRGPPISSQPCAG